MGDILEYNGSEEVQDKKQKKAAKHDDGVADLERVTDYAEEKEISATDITNAVNMFSDKHNTESEEKLAQERELQKIQVKREDIELIMNELLINRSIAEKALRMHKGDMQAALQELIN